VANAATIKSSKGAQEMRTGIRPRVNEAREFLEIAKDFKDPKEILREAISNSWDAKAESIALRFDLMSVQGTRRRKIRVIIQDDGEGMSTDPRAEVGSSEVEGFFNLGDSGKTEYQIGSKGHGTKIFYKSSGFVVTTHKNGKKVVASTEVDPWSALRNGKVPTYQIEETDAGGAVGTTIVIDGFEAKQREFSDISELIEYVKWYTVAGSFRNYFEHDRRINVELKPIGAATPITVPFGFQFPDENTDFSDGTENICKVFGPTTLDAGTSESGTRVQVEIVGALLGENHRNVVPHTYENMGLWLAKDYIRIERKNAILERAFGGQYWYRNFLIFANCQQFDLTANRNNVRAADEEYELAERVIAQWCEEVDENDFTKAYFEQKKHEDEIRRQEKDKKNQEEKEKRILGLREERINRYKGRPSRSFPGVRFGPLKEPQNEAETALLLQAMISSEHPGIDFKIGEYNTTRGVDLLVERIDKGIAGFWWVELVHSLANLTTWVHNPEGYHAIVCYDLGGVGEKFALSDGRQATLVKKQAAGRYVLTAGNDTYEVYVLRHIIDGTDVV
jgi:hypothetical protein